MRLVVGRIGRAHGIRGEVVVDERTDAPEQRFTVGTRLMTDPENAGPLTVKATRRHSARLLVRFESINDRTHAEELRGVTLLVDSCELPTLEDPDEFHDHELIGLSVVTEAGDEVGVVDTVLHTAQNLLVVKEPSGQEVLIPFVRDLVPEVDTDAGRLVIDAPPGLLDLRD